MNELNGLHLGGGVSGPNRTEIKKKMIDLYIKKRRERGGIFFLLDLVQCDTAGWCAFFFCDDVDADTGE